jgi:DNA-binding NarL/FixJ family response regulator
MRRWPAGSTSSRPDSGPAPTRPPRWSRRGRPLACFRRIDAPADTDAALALLRSLGSPTRLPPRDGQEPGGALSRREQEVLALVGAGLSNPQIASRLYLSPRTVEHHVGHIFAKLGLSSRAALAAYAARQEPDRGRQ